MSLAGRVFLLIAAGVGYAAWQAASKRHDRDQESRRRQLLTWGDEGGAQPGVPVPYGDESAGPGYSHDPQTGFPRRSGSGEGGGG